MRILVAGASGFLGRATVRSCVRAGHEVLGLVRSSEGAEAVARAGGDPVRGDVLSPATLGPALERCDAVVHLAQSRSPEVAEARAVRVDGASNLVAAALRARARRCVVGSGYWVYVGGPGVLREDSPIAPIGLAQFNFAAEERVRAAGENGSIDPIIVRPGMVYGDGSWFRSMVDGLRDGSYRYIADGRNRLSPVALEDAGEAFRAVLERGRPGATYLAVDDAPVATADFAEYVAREIDAAPPRAIPRAEADRAWGAELARLNVADRAASNARLKTLGWSPRYRSFRDGIPPTLRTMDRERRSG